MVLQSYIKPILTYGSETWTINKQTKSMLEAAEMWFLRRMMRISWKARKTNEEVLREADTQRQLITEIRKRQTSFVGHVLRKGGLEHIITTGKINGTRDRGRQREKLLDGLARWNGKNSATELIQYSKDRVLWRDMVANVQGQGTG